MCNEFRAGDCIAFDYTASGKTGACFLFSWCEGTVVKPNEGANCDGLCGYRNANWMSTNQQRSLESFFAKEATEAKASNTLNQPDMEYETLASSCANAVTITTNLHVSSVGECKTLCNDIGPGNCVALNTDGMTCYLLSHCEGTVGNSSFCHGHCSYRLNGQIHVNGGTRIASPGQNGQRANYETAKSNWTAITDTPPWGNSSYDEENYMRLTGECKNSVSLMLAQVVGSIAECEAMCDHNFPDSCVAINTNGRTCTILSHCEGTPGFCNKANMCGYVKVTKATAAPATTTGAPPVQVQNSFIQEFDQMDYHGNPTGAKWIKAHRRFGI